AMFERAMTSGGAVAVLVGLPLLVYYLVMCLAGNGGALIVPMTAREWVRLLSSVPAPTPTALAIVVGWLLVQGLLHVLVPGTRQDGMPLAGGSRLTYTMTGWRTWWLTWAGLAALVWLGGIPATILADQLGPLLTAANLVAFAISAGLLLFGRRERAAPGSV